MQNSLTKKLSLTVAAVAMAATGLFTTTDAEAVPAFARQTGMTCSSCHFQAFPALNSMGRSFRAGGYTMAGTQTLVEGENVSIPTALNIGAIWKVLYNSHGELAWPDEAALLVGGRGSASVGFLWELGLAESPNFLSSKIHFNVMEGDVNVAVVPFSTDAAGAAFGMELMNTAAQKSQRVIESRKSMSTGQITGASYGEATGLALVASTDSWMVNISKFVPGVAWDGPATNVGDMAMHIRVNYFLDIAGFDTGIGITSQSGSYRGTFVVEGATVVDGATDPITGLPTVSVVDLSGNYEATADLTSFDFQMQGQVGGSDLGIYFNMVSRAGDDGTTTAKTGYTYIGGHDAESGMGLTIKYSVSPMIQVFLANSTGTHTPTGADAISIGYSAFGVQYHVAENVKINAYSETNSNPADTAAGSTASTKYVVGWFVAM